MLWLTLFNRLGKQPLRITKYKHVTAIIDDKPIFLELKFKPSGEPYLVKAAGKAGRFKIGDKIYHKRFCKQGVVIDLTPDQRQVIVNYLNDSPKARHLVDAKDLKYYEGE